MAGLDPAIHCNARLDGKMDGRLKDGHDEERGEGLIQRANPSAAAGSMRPS
jgi:hypothetical protein